MNRVAIILLSAVALLFTISCESGDVDVYSEDEIVEANKALAQIVDVAFVENDPFRIETNVDDVYYYIVDSQDDADAFVEAVTCGEYSDDTSVFTLPAGFGSVSVSLTQREASYYLVDFDVVDYHGIRYILAHQDAIED